VIRMGDPKKPRKKYSTPRNPWRTDELSKELFLTGTYGLRNKRELWIAETELSRIRKQARNLLAQPVDVRMSEETRLLKYLKKIGVVGDAAELDDVLGLSIENLLERRLQTVVWKKSIAKSPHQARQMIAHGQVMIGDRVVDIPGYLVGRDEEGSVRLKEGKTIVGTAVPQTAS